MPTVAPATRLAKRQRSWPDPSDGYATYPAGRAHHERLRYLLQFAVFAPTFGEPRVRFRVGDDAIELRSLDATRAAALALGAALHHLRVAFEAFGEDAAVEEFPAIDAAASARITLAGRIEPSEHAQRLLVAAARRRETVAAFRPVRVPGPLVKALANECRRERALMRVVVGDERDALAALVAEPKERAALLEGSPLFLTITTGGDQAADWLAAGRALSAVLLRSAESGLSSAQFDAVIHDARVRAGLAALIRTERVPQVLLRVGYYDGPSLAPPLRPSFDELLEP